MRSALRIELMRVEDSHLILPTPPRQPSMAWLSVWLLGLPPVALLVYAVTH